MIRNFLLLAFRNLKKHKGSTIINVAGLAAGITSFLFIILYVANELSYDRFHNNYQNIYRPIVVGRMSGGEINQAITAAPMAQALLNDYPEVLKATRVTNMGAWLIRYGEKKFNEDEVLFADSTFFDVLDFRMLKGDPAAALARPRSLVMTEETAARYFGNDDPIGKRVNVEQDTVMYTVTGVMQNVPANSHIQFDMLASLITYPGRANNTTWVGHSMYTYITVIEGTDKNALEDKLQEIVIKYVGPQLKQILGVTVEDFRKAGNDFRYVLEPLSDIHLKGAPQYSLEPSGSLSTVYIFSVIAFLILVIAVINYVNLATARSASRAREVGVRKVAGITKPGLMLQFLSESMVIVTISALLAIALVIALTPAFSSLTGKEIPVSMLATAPGISAIAGLIIITGLASGFYPSFVLASFNPVEVLKGTMSPGSMSKTLRGILVVFQFTISIMIIIGSMIVYRQLNYMSQKDLGFEKENLLIIRRPDAFFRQRESFRNRLMEIPGVKDAGFTRAVPGTTFSNNGFLLDNDPEKNTYLMNQTQVSFDFPQTLGVKLVEGRFFSKEYGSDSTAILINEAAVKSLGLTDPVGKIILQPAGPQQFTRYEVIGVMKDFNIESMHKDITPVCFTVLGPQGGDQYAAVRLEAGSTSAVLRSIEEAWYTFTDTQPFQYEYFTDSWNNLYSSELKTGRIFLIFSLLAIILACLGLLGLMTFITSKRTREVGIRKTFGASSVTVLGILSKEVVYLILISSVIAYPLAWFGSDYWLGGFANRVSINPLFFILATVITLVTGWLAISIRAIRAASANPAESLRIN